MHLDNVEIEVLRKLKFVPCTENGNKSLLVSERAWVRRFGVGPVQPVLWVKKTVIGFDYRVLVSNSEKKKDEAQWFDILEVPLLVFSFLGLWSAWKKARRGLEGGPVRRLFRRHISR